MIDSLFRKEAIEEHRQRLYGDIFLLPKFSHTFIVTTLLIWTSAVAIWLFTSSYSSKETVYGWLEPPNGVIRIYPKNNGIIESVLIREGDLVEENQPLIIVNNNNTLASGENLESHLLSEYETQRNLLNEQLKRMELIFNNRIEDIHQRIDVAKSELKMILKQSSILAKQYRLIEKQIQRQSLLRDEGHISSFEFDSAITQELTTKSEMEALNRAQLTQKSLIEQLHTELNTLPDEYKNQVDQLHERLSGISQQIAQLSAQQSQVITAPKAGIVNNLQAVAGQLSQPGTNIPLMTIIPSDSNLTAQLLIPVRAAGFIAPSQVINIRYDAFPYQKFGIYRGEIETVSKTLLLPNELLNAPIALQDPVYRVTASLEQNFVSAYSQNFLLRPGMTISADIELSKRSLIQWLLDPIYSLQGRL